MWSSLTIHWRKISQCSDKARLSSCMRCNTMVKSRRGCSTRDVGALVSGLMPAMITQDLDEFKIGVTCWNPLWIHLLFFFIRVGLSNFMVVGWSPSSRYGLQFDLYPVDKYVLYVLGVLVLYSLVMLVIIINFTAHTPMPIPFVCSAQAPSSDGDLGWWFAVVMALRCPIKS